MRTLPPTHDHRHDDPYDPGDTLRSLTTDLPLRPGTRRPTPTAVR